MLFPFLRSRTYLNGLDVLIPHSRKNAAHHIHISMVKRRLLVQDDDLSQVRLHMKMFRRLENMFGGISVARRQGRLFGLWIINIFNIIITTYEW